ncbi:MAG: hypothetical protein LUD72_12690, partial [Bacteroidales bacterium]|nr:hypothetical protein [Bacteroidales bacterium]
MMKSILTYPFDVEYILSHRKKIKRQLLQELNSQSVLSKKIAVLGGSTTHDICLILELFLLNEGIQPDFYESEYNQYYQDAMFPNPALEQFAPDILYIHTSNRNIENYPDAGMNEDEIEELLAAETSKYTEMWDHLAEVYHCPI